MSELKKQPFLKGALILAVTNLLVKLLGALFKIPIRRFVLSGEGYGIYTSSYTIYNVLFIIATAGLPVAISKMVSESIAKNNFKEALQIQKIAQKLLLVIGIVGSLILFFGAKLFANSIGISEAWRPIMALAPCLFFVACMSVYRGMFQGMSNMIPTATSELIESCGKLIIGLALAFVLLDKTNPESTVSQSMAAAGAILGVSCGALLGAVYLFFQFRATKKVLKEKESAEGSVVSPSKTILVKLLKLAVPITIGSAVFTLASFIDLTMIVNLLKGLGYIEKERSTMWGYYNDAMTMFNLPPALVASLSVSVVPAISTALTAKKFAEAKATTETAIRIALLFALPCAIGMSVLAGPILNLVIKDMGGADMLTVLAYGVAFVSVVMVSNAILQSNGKVWTPVIHMLLGGVVKIIVNFILVGNPSININGAPYGTVLCYLTVMVLNLLSVQKLLHPNYGWGFILKTLCAVALMGVVAYYVNLVLVPFLGSNLSLLVAIGAGGVTYLVLLVALRALKKQDVEAMPGSKYILKLIGRFI